MITAAGSGELYRLHLGGAVLDRVAPDESSGLSSTEIASIGLLRSLLVVGSKAAETTKAAFNKWKRRIALPDSLTMKDARNGATKDESGTPAAAIDPLGAGLVSLCDGGYTYRMKRRLRRTWHGYSNNIHSTRSLVYAVILRRRVT